LETTYQQTSRIDRIIFYGIIFLLIFAPLAFGSVHVWAYSVIEVGVFLLMGLWFVDRLIFSKSKSLSWVKTPVNLILILLLVLIGLQLIPLPAFVTKLISPQTYADKKQVFAVLANASDASTDGSPGMMLSYTSHATKVEWLKLAAYFGMFFIVLNTATSKQRINILVYTMIFIGLFEALYAVYQVFSITPKVWWWKSRVGGYRYASGTFIVSNHFAGYMEMVLCLAFGFLIAQKRQVRRVQSGLNEGRSFLKKCVTWLAPESARPKMIFFFFVTLIIGVALLLSASRGGILSLGVSMLLMALLFLSKKRYRIYGGLALCLCVAILAYGLHVGIDPTLKKFENPKNLYGRLHITRTILPMIGDYPYLGVGLGNFRYVYPRYIDDYDRVRGSNYAHNDWVEAGIETGVLGVFLILVGFGIYMVRMMGIWRERRDFHALGIGAGVVAAFLSISLHSYFDFNMHIPANPLTLAALLAVGYAAVHRQRNADGESFFYGKRDIPLTRWRLIGILGLVVVGFGISAGWTGKHLLAEAACPTEWNSTMNLDWRPALPSIEKAISLNSDNYEYHNKRALHFISLNAENKEEEEAYSLETKKSLEQALRRNPAMGILWHNLGRNYSSATYDMFDYLNKWLPLADVCFDVAVHCAPKDEYLLLNAGRYWVWRSRLLTEKKEEGKKVGRLEGRAGPSAVRGQRSEVRGQGRSGPSAFRGQRLEVRGRRSEVGEKKGVLFREDGIRKFQGYFQRLLTINPDLWKEVVQQTRVYFSDDAVALGIVPENNEALESRVLGFLAKTESSGSVKTLGQIETHRYHTVESGESIYGISRRYGVAVKKILLMNNLDLSAVVYPGQRLRVGN
jgi:O-antigen ligase